MGVRSFTLVCLANIITGYNCESNPLDKFQTPDNHFSHGDNKERISFSIQNHYNTSHLGKSIHQGSINIQPRNHYPPIQEKSFSTIYKSHQKPLPLFSSVSNSSQVFSKFQRNHNRRDASVGGGWGSWGINLMNQYLGDGHHPHEGHGINPLRHHASQAAQISKVIFTKAKLMGEMLELSRISTQKFADMLLYLGKLKSVPLPLFGNQHIPVPGATHGWKSSGDVHTAPVGKPAGGIGWGWNGRENNGNVFKNLGYTLGSSLAGVGKFAKIMGNGYNVGIEDQKWATHGSENVNDHDDNYPTYKTTNPSKGGQLLDNGAGNPTTGNGFGYNYGNGNEYNNGGEGWHGGVTTTTNVGGDGGNGIEGTFDGYDEGGSDVTTGVRKFPEFKPI